MNVKHKRLINKAIHRIKARIPNNPDFAFDKKTGDVFDKSSMEYIGNLLDEMY